tara:strand:- start:428 stop:1612 length:1185 start_codon:yes stop_codon:yes gene_type:complete
MKKYTSKQKHCFFTILISIVILILIYYYFFSPLHKIHTLQDDNFVNKWWEIIILGLKDKNYTNMIINSDKIKNIGLWYQFQILNTKNKHIFIYLRNINKFTKEAALEIYYFDKEKKEKKEYSYKIHLNQFKTYKRNNTLITEYNGLYLYKNIFDLSKKTIKTYIKSKDLNIQIIFSILSNRTVQIDHVNRYEYLLHNSGIMFKDNIYLSNQIIGKIDYIRINKEIEKSGFNYFESGLGSNHYYLTEYVWFVLLNKDWVFWFTNYANKKFTYLYDNIKKKIIYCGIMDFKLFSKVEYNTGGGEKDFHFNFYMKVDNFEIKMRSIPGDYNKVRFKPIVWHKNTKSITINKENKKDIDYYLQTKDLKLIDYLNYANININYENKKYNFNDWVSIQVV